MNQPRKNDIVWHEGREMVGIVAEDALGDTHISVWWMPDGGVVEYGTEVWVRVFLKKIGFIDQFGNYWVENSVKNYAS